MSVNNSVKRYCGSNCSLERDIDYIMCDLLMMHFRNATFNLIVIAAHWRLRCPLHHLLNKLRNQIGEEDSEMELLSAPYRFEHRAISKCDSESSSGESDSNNAL